MTSVSSRVRAIGHYTADEAARLVGVSPRRTSRWSSYGIVPSISQHPSVYSYADVGEAILAHYLINLGWRPTHVKGLVERLRKKWGQWPLATAPLEHEGKLVVIKEGDNLVLDALDRIDNTVLHETLNLEEVRRALRRGGWVSLPEEREHIEVDPLRAAGGERSPHPYSDGGRDCRRAGWPRDSPRGLRVDRRRDRRGYRVRRSSSRRSCRLSGDASSSLTRT